jgi:hypothetical protein
VGYLAPRSLGVGYPCRPALLPNWDGLRPLRTTSQLQEHRQWGRREGFCLGVSVSSCCSKANTGCQQGRGETGAWRPQARNAQSYRWLNGGVSLVARLTLPSPQRTCGSPALYIDQDAVTPSLKRSRHYFVCPRS